MQVGEQILNGLIINEPGLTSDQKQFLMGQVSSLSDNKSPGISTQEIAGSGMGALTGYIAAKSIGAGPVVSATAAILGGLGGRALAKPYDEEHTLGIPGFYLPY